MDATLRRAGYAVLIVLLGAVAWLHLVGKIDLATADLGRHIRNGELAVLQHKIIDDNYYAYTYPEFRTECHHWGIGVIFYLLWRSTGFFGLSIFYGALLFATLALFTWSAVRSSSLMAALLAAAFALPLLGYRTEIRPEGVSTFCLALLFFLLNEYRSGRIGGRWLWIIPALQLFWVNVHILFFTGIAVTGFFALDAWLNEGTGPRLKLLLGVLAASVAVAFINPFGVSGALEPLTIFRVYGYRLAENQNVLFMIKRFPGRTIYAYFLMVFAAAMFLFALKSVGDRGWRRSVLHFLLLAFFGLMAAKAVRAIAMFGFFFIPLAAENIEGAIGRLGGRPAKLLRRGLAATAAIAILLAAATPYFMLSPVRKYASLIDDKRYGNSLFYILARPSIWAGLSPGVNASAEFFKAQGLKGPVFNNYDLGGYFIFHLFPGERPFVDNRPEAYPVDFFQKTYGPMQEDEKVWDEVSRKYGFQVIYFYRHDMTNWGQPFLIRRLADPQWAPVFVDGYCLVLAKRGGANQGVIDKFELPKDIFRIRKN